MKSVVALGALDVVGSVQAHDGELEAGVPSGAEDRRYWASVLERLTEPVLSNLARGELKRVMPVETSGDRAARSATTHLEAFGRLMAGIAPWLAADVSKEEAQTQRRYRELALASLDMATNPESPDYLNFDQGGQPLVDAAFLAQGLLRAPKVLLDPLSDRLRMQLVHALKSSRVIEPSPSNWVMFAAMVEALLFELGEETVEARLEASLRHMLGWYKGDGMYGDGEWFRCDYYNSFVIQPMLLEVLEVLKRHDPRYQSVWETVVRRARRWAEIQERFIAPDGTFPCVGRSMAYRFGAFQTLSQTALMRLLPDHVAPGQVRAALTAVIRRMIEAPGTFDADGWLRIGFCGHQPAMGEGYISTGSLYLCSVGLLPLGLAMTEPFWADPPTPWTSQRLWAGEDLPRDHALRDEPTPVEVPTLTSRRRV